jgi:molybdopterin-guanine dinucleotide biosynthesis protein A
LDLAVDHLAAVAKPIAVSATPGSKAEALAKARRLTVLYDRPGDPRGPLAGVRAGLQWAAEKKLDFLAVEPCDAPRLPPDLHARLWAEIGEAPAAFAQTCEGVQPLCSLWRPSALAAVEAALSSGEHPPVWRLLGEIGAVAVYFPGEDAFTNANTQETLERTR